jgi:hypothetical protein
LGVSPNALKTNTLCHFLSVTHCDPTVRVCSRWKTIGFTTVFATGWPETLENIRFSSFSYLMLCKTIVFSLFRAPRSAKPGLRVVWKPSYLQCF